MTVPPWKVEFSNGAITEHFETHFNDLTLIKAVRVSNDNNNFVLKTISVVLDNIVT